MVAAENFVAELDTKNQASIQRVVDALSSALAKDGVEVADALLRLLIGHMGGLCPGLQLEHLGDEVRRRSKASRREIVSSGLLLEQRYEL